MHTSYHCHTVLSDGLSTIPDYVRAGIAAGLDELGISEHYTLLPDTPPSPPLQGGAKGGYRTVDWSMPKDGLPGYFRALHAARDQAADRLIVRCGLEADYIPETADELAGILRAYPFDYVIGSVHFVDDFLVDESAGAWDALSEDERNDMVRAYWGRITDMAASGLFDIAAHLDLYKKFGHRPTVDVSEDTAIALDAIAKSRMAVELNTAGFYRMGEIYPSPTILRECHERGIPALVTTDAHHADQLTRSLDLGVAELREAGYTRQAVFAERGMSLVEL